MATHTLAITTRRGNLSTWGEIMLFDKDTTYEQAVGFREQAKHALVNDAVVRACVTRIVQSLEFANRGSQSRDEACIDVAQTLMTYAEMVNRRGY